MRRSMMVITMLALLAGVVTAPPAAAADATTMCFAAGQPSAPQNDIDRARTVNDGIVAMLKAGRSDTEIVSALARDYGVVSPSASVDRVAPLSTGSDIALQAPRIAYDTCAHRWYAFAHYDWTSLAPLRTERQSVFCGDPCPIGGVDGFGLAFSRPVASVSGYFMQTWGVTPMYPPSTGRTWVQDANTYGVTFVGQDEFCSYYVWGQPGQSCYNNNDYSFYHGELMYLISNIGCGTIQAFSKYGHDWSNTTINGFSVGPWSLGISWSSSTNRWEKTSAPSNAVTPC